MFVHGCMCHMGAAVQLHMGLMDDRGVLSRVAVAGWRWLLQAAMWSPLQPPSFLHAPRRMCTPALRAVGFPACAAFYIVMAVLNTVKSASQTAEHVRACVYVSVHVPFLQHGGAADSLPAQQPTSSQQTGSRQLTHPAP